MNLSESPEIFVGILGLGLIQIVALYEAAAPSMQDLRNMPISSSDGRQQLLDTDLVIGTTTIIVALSAAIVMKSVWPLIMFGGGFTLISTWHHLVLNSPN